MNDVVILFSIFLVFGICIWGVIHEDKEKRLNAKRYINANTLCRDYSDVPGVNACPRCGSKAHVTTTVDIPAISSEPGKLEFDQGAMRIYYSVHCNNCSLGTDNREEMAEVMNDWNSQKKIGN